LEPLTPSLKAYIIELESATPLPAAAVLTLEPLLLAAIPALGTAYGQLPGFYVKKAIWMVKQGQHQAALHAMWLMMAISAGTYVRGDNALRTQGADLMQRWLKTLGYEELDNLIPQVPIAETLFKEVEHLVTFAASNELCT